MTTKEEYLDSLVNDFIDSIKKEKRAKVTEDGYRWLIRKANRRMIELGLEANPKKWDEETVLLIRDHVFADIRPSVARREMSVLSTYAQFHGNPIIKDMQLEWPQDDRTNVSWLSPTQAIAVQETAQGIERMVVHLELNLGLRRVEVLRLKVRDFGLGYVNVLGKGRMGGKPRTLAFHPNTLSEINVFHAMREAEIAKARAKDPSVTVPDALLVYEMKGRLHAYKRLAVDKMLARVSERTGLEFTNHTLRRTFGRTAWLAGVPLETIKEMLGHEDTKTTVLYLGLNMDDQADAMKKIGEFQSAVNYGKNGSSQTEKWTERDFCPRKCLDKRENAPKQGKIEFLSPLRQDQGMNRFQPTLAEALPTPRILSVHTIRTVH
jgi:integrase